MIRGRALRVADLGTGSGALLLALLRELPAARGVGTDISVAALACARDECRGARPCRPRVVRRLRPRRGAWWRDDGGGFDLVVANPPYVASGDIAGLQPEVRDFDPRRALDGGAGWPGGLSRDRRRRAATAGARMACWCSNSAPASLTPSLR